LTRERARARSDPRGGRAARPARRSRTDAASRPARRQPRHVAGRAAHVELDQPVVTQIFLETERLILREFTEDDADNLVELDGDPDVMRFINGGRPTPRQEIEDDYLPAFLAYYQRFEGYGFWAAEEK